MSMITIEFFVKGRIYSNTVRWETTPSVGDYINLPGTGPVAVVKQVMWEQFGGRPYCRVYAEYPSKGVLTKIRGWLGWGRKVKTRQETI